jgi:fructose-bisphosphate aldolase class II/tagatose 1,6-diphosphate aldolase GatY/KbaY
LVLHGGSGLGADVWTEAIRRGITKINLATEVKDTFMRTLRAGSDSQEIDLRKVFLPAISAVSELLSHKFQICRQPTFTAPSRPLPSTG